jgi:protein-S-isoprenylcysteine O-methyltransferase Ste14
MPPWVYVLIIFGFILLSSILFVVVKNRAPRQATDPGDLSNWAVWGAGLLGLAITLLDWIFLKSQSFSTTSLILGAVISLGGIIIRVLSRLALGKYYTPRLSILSDHKLITTGIYGIIRHPGYLGFLMIAAGMCLIFGSGWGIAVMAIGFFPAILFRIRREEGMLKGFFGGAYETYVARTYKLIPYLF